MQKKAKCDCYLKKENVKKVLNIEELLEVSDDWPGEAERKSRKGRTKDAYSARSE